MYGEDFVLVEGLKNFFINIFFKRWGNVLVKIFFKLEGYIYLEEFIFLLSWIIYIWIVNIWLFFFIKYSNFIWIILIIFCVFFNIIFICKW